ncbi:MAG: TOTE conflict system archaeo-eukaryotic primase domain-containing protein, partial [Thermoanaerobaculia bacterium]
MGCYLLTETMARRHQLSMESYDRLFPSQDTMPRGGFGNLIALPLQREARRQGNSVFLDERLNPYADDEQWTFLASLALIEAATVELIAREASRLGSVVGVRLAESLDSEDASPWTRPPSGRVQDIIAGPFTANVAAVLAQKLFVEKADLSSPLINRIKRLAAFQNPEFYKKQSMRLSTALTPRVIACAEDLPQHIGLPRGCRDELEALLRSYGINFEVEDQRVAGDPLSVEFRGQLTPTQRRAVRSILAQDIGVFVAPPGVEKTVVGTYLIAKRSCSTLILVHRRPLLDQWVAQLSLFLGIEPKEIGQIGAGKRKGNGRIDVAMIQSLGRKGSVDDAVATYDR